MVDDFLFIYSLTKAGIFAIILVLLRGDNIMGYTLDKDGIKEENMRKGLEKLTNDRHRGIFLRPFKNDSYRFISMMTRRSASPGQRGAPDSCF